MGAYREWEPPAWLRPWLDCIWMRVTGEDHGTVVRVLPDACTDLMWIDGVLRVAGPDTTVNPAWCPPGGRVVGVRFRPGTLAATTRAGLDEIANQRVEVEDLWGGDMSSLAARAADAVGQPVPVLATLLLDAVAERVSEAGEPDPLVRAVEAACRATPTEPIRVRTLAADLHVSERQLRRRCKQALGYGPKTFDRILRFQRFLRISEAGQPGEVATAAAAVGYADQPHLTRECQRLAGLAPAALLAGRAP